MAHLTEMPKVGDGITVHGYSDAHAYTVVSTHGTTAFKARRDKATRSNRDEDTFSVGGFFGHTSHPKGQKYEYEADPDGAMIRVTRRKNGAFRVSNSNMRVTTGRHEFYDYNF